MIHLAICVALAFGVVREEGGVHALIFAAKLLLLCRVPRGWVKI